MNVISQLAGLKLTDAYLKTAINIKSANARPAAWYADRKLTIKELVFPGETNSFDDVAELGQGESKTVKLSLQDEATAEYFSMNLRDYLTCKREGSDKSIAEDLLNGTEKSFPTTIHFKSATDRMTKFTDDDTVENKQYSIFAYKAFQDAVKKGRKEDKDNFSIGDLFEDQALMDACNQSMHKEPLALQRANTECLKNITVA